MKYNYIHINDITKIEDRFKILQIRLPNYRKSTLLIY